MKSQRISRSSKMYERPFQPLDPFLLRFLLNNWNPERPELLLRLRPRPYEESHVTR